ncbi:toxin-antitoxin system YwqK family antitoxin [Brumimicrobium salinarum]|nr:toxin-antitoxin system YwqK family antitoxin [Brumimicrobium salinarum]
MQKTITSLLCLLFVTSTFVYGQNREKLKNRSKRQLFYYDPIKKTKLESQGYYYVDELGETTERHDKWSFYNKKGELIEERNYHRNKLHGEVKTYYGANRVKNIGYFENGIQDSLYVAFHLSGDTSEVGYYHQGEPTGKWRYFYRDGHLKTVEEVIDSISYIWSFYAADSAHTQTVVDGNGEMAEYYTNGNLKSWYNYKDGLRHGKFEEASVHGYYLLKGSFLENQPDGKWEYFYYTGDLEKVSHYAKGKLHGNYRYYYDNGELSVAGQYEYGKKTGEWTWYTNSGVVDMKGNFKEDLQHGAWVYNYPSGKVSYRAKYKHGKKSGKWKYYYKNGKKFKVGHFDNDLKNGEWTTWYENGNTLMEGDYKNDLEEGLWKNYWENGQLKNQSTFTKGKLNGEWLSFYSNGIPLSKGNYDMGQKSGEWTEYFKNGRKSDITNYKVVEQKSKTKYGPMKDRVNRVSIKHGDFVSFSQKDFSKTQEGKYKNGEKHGTWTTYHKGGLLPAVIANYKKGELHGKMKTFEFRGNQIISEVNYKNGRKDGKAKVFDKDGKVVKEMTYENGVQIIEGTKSGSSFAPGR